MPISAEVEAAIKFATFYNSLILETVLFGFSSAFFLLSIYFLLRKGIKSRADAIMLATSTFIQCTSIIHWSLEVTIWCQFVIMAIPLTEPILQARFWMSILCVALTDAFVVWRATMLWTRSPWRVAVSGCIVTLDTAVHLFAMGTTALSPYGFWAPGTASIAVSVLCNLWATVLVANKSWLETKYRTSGLSRLMSGPLGCTRNRSQTSCALYEVRAGP
ncbi:hypothetical protein BC834DRAFT_852759 [Gloeopeniophorella convolvens]|nr:hypothetical protein BC834DRAFT_852759 [Gloeopeniophorella convolvens]